MNTTAAPPILDHLSALGDETRTRILALLERSELTVSELCDAIQLPQPTVSRHLRTLADDGWVVSRAEGRNRHYRVSPLLDGASLELWRIVRDDLQKHAVYTADAERARGVMAERHRRAATFFAGVADRWDDLRVQLFGSRAELLPLFALLDGRWTVGDLGCGTGALAALLAPFVHRIIGVDRSDAMLAAARRRLEGIDNVELRAGDLENLPVADGELDLAVLSLVLHYVADPRDVLEEAHRALGPGGRVLLVEMRSHERGAEYAEEMGHVWPGFDPGRMTQWLLEAGFQAVQARPIPPDPAARGPLVFVATGTRGPGAEPTAAADPHAPGAPGSTQERTGTTRSYEPYEPSTIEKDEEP
jgi:ubiquinone/menaquinone biosynthesis C-methylase UbiE/DNA-binding HxlR family transcriptional regulator